MKAMAANADEPVMLETPLVATSAEEEPEALELVLEPEDEPDDEPVDEPVEDAEEPEPVVVPLE